MTSTPSLPTSSDRRRRILSWWVWLPRVALALVFVGGGLAKLGGDPAMVAMFDEIGSGQGLRFVVGGLELAGGVGVLVPQLAGLAASGLALLMMGASVVNIAVLETSPVVTVLLLAVAALVVWHRRNRLNPIVVRRPLPSPIEP
jgi:uncharacterized membrane protein